VTYIIKACRYTLLIKRFNDYANNYMNNVLVAFKKRYPSKMKIK
jgi:hypothetical protein